MGLTVSRQTALNLTVGCPEKGNFYRQPSKKQFLLAIKGFEGLIAAHSGLLTLKESLMF